jgi:hypothetical protein
MFSVVPTVHFTMHASSCVNIMLRFDSRGDRNVVLGLNPIIHDGARISLERVEEMSNRFFIEQKWLMAVSAVNFLKEHLDLEQIPAGFCNLGTIVDIDPACLGDDHLVLRVVMARRITIRIQNDLYVENSGRGMRGESLGMAFSIKVLWIWPRKEQLDELGNLCPFFPRLPSGGNGGGNA